ncbi:Fic family protein [Candidatus Parcubacteria bacterium]|nr:Fic family protein [Candidatus Parcubacteria bacterium]
MSKTKPSYRETKFGILSIREIEALITDGVANVNAFLLREFKNLPINIDTAKELHEKVAGHVFEEAGNFRKNEVKVGNYEPPKFFQIPELMVNWENDYNERHKHAKNQDKKIELLAWMMHQFLLIHPFFDYNGRVARLLGQLFLLQHKLPISSFIGIKRTDFAAAMKKSTSEKDAKNIIKLINKSIQ